MKLPQPQARPTIGRACLTKRLRNASCRLCLESCPSEAITLINGQMQIDADACTRCGNCLYVCPANALENLSLPKRNWRDAALIAPLSPIPPTVEELLIWHETMGIRTVEMEVEENPGWLMALAALNLRLKQKGEQSWSIAPPSEKQVNSGRRRWLQLHAASQHQSAAMSPAGGHGKTTYNLHVDQDLCYLCSACARICPQNAIAIDEQRFTLDSARCVGCNACKDVCIPHALSVEEDSHSSQTSYELYQAKCSSCSKDFLAWQKQAGECYICRQHAFGMR